MATHKAAAKRRLDRFLPSNSGKPSPGRGETFRNPGNKAGQGMNQQNAPTPSSGDGAQTNNLMSALAAARKAKTKTQPAVHRRVNKMKMSGGRGY